MLDNKKLTLTFFLSCSFHLRHFSFNYFDYDYCKDLAFLTEPTVSKATNQLINPKNVFFLSADSPKTAFGTKSQAWLTPQNTQGIGQEDFLSSGLIFLCSIFLPSTSSLSPFYSSIALSSADFSTL